MHLDIWHQSGTVCEYWPWIQSSLAIFITVITEKMFKLYIYICWNAFQGPWIVNKISCLQTRVHVQTQTYVEIRYMYNSDTCTNLDTCTNFDSCTH